MNQCTLLKQINFKKSQYHLLHFYHTIKVQLKLR